MMFPSALPGRMLLVRETVGNGRTPLMNWLMLRVMRSRSLCDPKYPIIMPSAGPTCCSKLTFHVCIRPLWKFGSTDVGASPEASAVVTALSSRILPENVTGVASGGFADKGDTTLPTGMSTMTAYALRITVRPSLDGFQIAPRRGWRLWPALYGLFVW